MSLPLHERLTAQRLIQFALFALSISALDGCSGGGSGSANANSAIPSVASPSTGASPQSTPTTSGATAVPSGAPTPSGSASPNAQKSPALQPTTLPNTALNTTAPLPLNSPLPTLSPNPPTPTPSGAPTTVGSSAPTNVPTITPTPQPTKTPASAQPTVAPTLQPTITPTTQPTLSPRPTSTPVQTIPTPPSSISGGAASSTLTSGSVTSACAQRGTYGTNTVLEATGNITNGTYTAASPGSTWQQVTYAVQQSTSTPVPSYSPIIVPIPSQSSTPLVVQTPSSYLLENIYSGTFSLPNTPAACFLLIGSADGSSIIQLAPGSQYNAAAVGFVLPPLGAKVVDGAQGNIASLSISHLSPSSGSGTFQLDNGQTGTISITNFGTFESPQYGTLSLTSGFERIPQDFRRF